MTWGKQPLDTISTPDITFWTGVINNGIDKGNESVDAVNDLKNQVIPSLDFTGVDPVFVYPTSISVSLPDMPTVPTYQAVPTLSVITPPDNTLHLAFAYTDIAALGSAAQTLLVSVLSDPTNAIEEALFDRAIDRETAALGTGYQNYLNNQSSMGFAAASGQDQAIYAAFETQKKSKLSDINRDIMTNAYKESLNVLVPLLSSMIDAEKSGEANNTALFVAKVEQALNQIKGVAETNQLLAETYKAEIDAFSTVANLIIGKDKEINSYNQYVGQYAVEKVKAIGNHELGKANAVIEAAKSIGSVGSTFMASCLNAMNYSQSWSYGTHWSGDVNVSQ